MPSIGVTTAVASSFLLASLAAPMASPHVPQGIVLPGQSTIALTLNGDAPSVRHVASGASISLTALDEIGDGEDAYQGMTPDNKPVKVTLLSALPAINLESVEPIAAPHESVPVPETGDAVEEETTVEVPAVNKSDLSPVLALATSETSYSLVAPAGSRIDSVDIDGVQVNNVGMGGGDTTKPVVYSGVVTQDGTHNLAVKFDEGDYQRSLSLDFQATNATTAAASPYGTASRTQFRYATFIPNNRVDVPTVCHPTNTNGTYNGNNRTWKPGYTKEEFLSYKTAMGVDFNWLKLNQTFKKGVGVSKEYNSQGALIKTGVASSAGMKFFGNYINKTYGRARMNHSVGNPLCWAAGDIFYTATVDSWRSGKMQITTRRVKAPSHEFYARGASPYWTIMGRQNLQSFFCLNLNCGTESYSATKSVW